MPGFSAQSHQLEINVLTGPSFHLRLWEGRYKFLQLVGGTHFFEDLSPCFLADCQHLEAAHIPCHVAPFSFKISNGAFLVHQISFPLNPFGQEEPYPVISKGSPD